MASQLLTLFALFSVGQGYPTLSSKQFGEIEMPSLEEANEIRDKCYEKTRFVYESITLAAMKLPSYLKADEEERELFKQCALNRHTGNVVACISDHTIVKSYDPGPQDEEYQSWASAFRNDKNCRIHFIMAEENSCKAEFVGELFDARIKLLEKASQEKEYFRSHVTALKRVENQRIKLQCKN